ncbi:MAG: VWA domain-containing protein [Syntrophothermus sp.]
MKKLFFLLAAFFITSTYTYSNGVGVIDANLNTHLKLINSKVFAVVENQVSIITVNAVFKNNFTGQKNFSYAFPLPEGASVTNFIYYINGKWDTAHFTAGSPDTTLPGGTMNSNLKTYLGAAPFFFDVPEALKADSVFEVKLTYVQLLTYNNGNVEFFFPNNYSLIDSGPLTLQQFEFQLSSLRSIDSLTISEMTPDTFYLGSNSGYARIKIEGQPATKNYYLKYKLNSNELGLFGMSTMLPTSLVPDQRANGFGLFVVEPSPSSQYISKVFTIIIDKSGSMYGPKMDQAKNAAKYIINNLNEGDKFNVVDFETYVYKFKNEHVTYSNITRDEALAYINNIAAGGSTNISGAFETAIPQFSIVNDSTANIIIFLTDGEQTAGILDNNELILYIRNLVTNTDSSLQIYTFGIGDYVNAQLLTTVATQNSGLCELLGNSELYSRLTSFYNKIKNPVLLQTHLTLNPVGSLTDVVPDPLPNLYKGTQLIVSGRYSTAQNTSFNFSGKRFGQPVSYNFDMNLTDSNITKYSFLTKMWAKLKIEDMLVDYYLLNPNSTEAQELKQAIITLSIKFGVSSVFTVMTGGGNTGVEDESADANIILKDFQLLGNYPNPFNPTTTISFKVGKSFNEIAYIKIYNTLGELVRELYIYVDNEGIYNIMWDGKDFSGQTVPSGNYIYTISLGNNVFAGKMTLLK